MKKIVKGALAIFAGVGGFGVSTIVASANRQYSVARSNSVKLVWRRSMGQHALTATKGARYSKHLGVRYSNNAATKSVTWYTDAHEKLYRKAKGNSAIYYHIKSADGALQGWIWRGYLKQATDGSRTGTTDNATQTTPVSGDAQVVQAIKDLGHGAKPDPASMSLAKRVLKQATSGQYTFQTIGQLNPANPNLKDSTTTAIFGVDTAKPLDSTEEQWATLMANNGIGNFGMGTGLAQTGLLIEDHLDLFNRLSGYNEPSTEFYGQQGLTAKNFFRDVKIGVATTTLKNGQQAMFAIFRYPAKYSQLTYNE